MKRRDFLKFTGSGIAAIAVGSAGGWSMFRPRVARAHVLQPIDLTMVEAEHEMVDGIIVPAWAYSTQLAPEDGSPLGARIPGPVIFATEGDVVTLNVTNSIPNGGAHGFEIVDVPGASVASIPFGGTVEIKFTAPTAGTYMYLDPQNAPVNRVMGLHGVLVVLPQPVANTTPYSAPTQAVRNLFNDFGVADHFPGHPWHRDRNVIWFFSSIDPIKHQLAYNSGSGIDPAEFSHAREYLPQYFLINGKSGFFAAQHGGEHHSHGITPDSQSNISVHGHVGQPALIRCLNAGLFWHSPHIHGNHVYEIFEYVPAQVSPSPLTSGVPRKVLDNLQLVDTWTLPPGGMCDVVLPFISPPDIPANFWDRVAAGTNEELLPLVFPMHDHQEVSNTAAGGNYPQGAATHWQIDSARIPGDDGIDLLDEVILVDRAELRVRTGEILLEGRLSANSPTTVLSVHAGLDHHGTQIGTITVDTSGPGMRRWRYRDRALAAMSNRTVSLHTHTPGSHAEVHGIHLTLR